MWNALKSSLHNRSAFERPPKNILHSDGRLTVYGIFPVNGPSSGTNMSGVGIGSLFCIGEEKGVGKTFVIGKGFQSDNMYNNADYMSNNEPKSILEILTKHK